MQPGEKAEVKLPAEQTWHPTLFDRAGSREVVAFIWVGEEAEGDDTIYVAFNPLRKKRQFFKLLGAGATLVDDTISRVADSVHVVRTFSYVKRKLDSLWSKYDFESKLLSAVRQYPEHRIIFCGLSHGATMAQAVALKFSLLHPDVRVMVASWNAYKWTDAAGSALVQDVIGTRLLPFVLSREAADGTRRWDTVAGAPAGLAPMKRITLLDADSGKFLPCENPGDVQLGLRSALRAGELHFAKTALKATKMAMSSATSGGLSRSGSFLGDSVRSMSSIRSMKSLVWSSPPPVGHQNSIKIDESVLDAEVEYEGFESAIYEESSSEE